AHRTRLSWHLRRIYLARNQILHNDRVLPYLPTLVENLHSYVDILIKAIISLGARSVMHDMTIPTAFELLASHEATFIGALKRTDESCNSKNFKRVIFGQHNPLSPF
ncbi:MAG: hypothetical protein D3919_12710, partial [Candidatus Electrothrix sp. AW5]|nr:hypothetical protein [Candidatus Electrothrix gigas]